MYREKFIMEELALDPLGDRVMKNVPMMAATPLKSNDLWKKTSKYLQAEKLEVGITHSIGSI